MTHKLSRYLEELWLPKKDSEVYLTLLKLWSSVVGTISKECGIPRATTYQILDRLVDDKLVMKIDKDNILTYFPEGPEKILMKLSKQSREIEKKMELAEKLLPHLENLKNPYKANPRITYFEWIEWYKELMNKSLVWWTKELMMITNSRQKKNIPWDTSKLEEIMRFEQEEYWKKRIEKRIRLRLMTNWGELPKNQQNDETELQEIRILPERFWDTETMVVFWDSVIMITDNYPLIWIYIEERQIATMMQNMFDFIWNSINP